MTYDTDPYDPRPSQVEVAGVDGGSQRCVRWTWGTSDVPGVGYDCTELYIAPDENGDLHWWRQIIENTVGNPGEREKISLRDALKAVEPCYWPILCAWTLEALDADGCELTSERWGELSSANPDARAQLLELLVALVPDGHERVLPVGAARSAAGGARRDVLSFDDDAMRERAEQFRTTYGYPSTIDLLQRLEGLIDGGTRQSLANGACGPVYDVARSHGLVTDGEYRAARLEIGDRWNYAGN